MTTRRLPPAGATVPAPHASRRELLVAMLLVILLAWVLPLLFPAPPATSTGASAPAVQGGSTAAAPLRIPADAWNVTVAWTPTPGPSPVPPTELHWTDGHTGQPCSWTQATGVVCGGR
jgi:hypothetical protein